MQQAFRFLPSRKRPDSAFGSHLPPVWNFIFVAACGLAAVMRMRRKIQNRPWGQWKFSRDSIALRRHLVWCLMAQSSSAHGLQNARRVSAIETVLHIGGRSSIDTL